MRRNKKIMKRLGGIIITIVMMIGMMATTAFAADQDATITIKKGGISKDWSGMQVKAYMVLDQENPNVTEASKKQYKVTENFRDFFNITQVKAAFEEPEDVYLGYDGGDNANHLIVSSAFAEGYIKIDNTAPLDDKYPEADLVGRMESMGDKIATFYTWIEKYIEAESITETTSATATSSEKINFTTLDEGYYALTFSNVPDGVSVIQGILVATPGEIDLKAEELPLTKTVKPVDNKTDYAASATAELGEKLSYKITSKVPTLTDYSNLTQFEFTDTLIRQETTSDTFKLTIDGATVTKDGNNFKIENDIVATLSLEAYGTVQDTANPEDQSKKVPGQKFTVTFVPGVLKDYQGSNITLTYQAALTGDAVNVNANNVTLTYTNGPDTKELTADTKVYTYGIEVTKKFSDGLNSDNYKGVTFKLYANSNNNAKGSQIPLTGSDGVYQVTTDDNVNNLSALNITSDGKLTITGLDEGTYWLEEVSAPDGYTKAEDIKITLVKDEKKPEELNATNSTAQYNGKGTEFLTTVTKQNTTNISLGQFEVFNQKGFNLPQTGGAGTWMLTIGGIVLIAAAGGLFVASRRKASK